ncbi:MAG: hypothetical protein QOG64_2608 [Acidimicrobiaceae bacterium]|nr:hypothetical protein [Acidimicrobiaceae bacterium]
MAHGHSRIVRLGHGRKIIERAGRAAAIIVRVSGEGSHRLRWEQLPDHVQGAVANRLGSRVVRAEGQRGGYGPGVAARCQLADGRRVFVKAVSPAQNPESPAMMRREASLVARLPAEVPAPRLLEVLDDGTWIVLVFEEVRGRQPTIPWSLPELRRVSEGLSDLRCHPPPAGWPNLAEQYGSLLTGWRTLAAEAVAEPALDIWCRDHLDDLAALEAGWEAAASGEELVHGDVRSDNVLLVDDAGGRVKAGVVFVDWSSASAGAGWFDLAAMLPSVALEGGGAPEAVLATARGASVDPTLLPPVVAALAGYFLEAARRPDPSGLPTVRAFQRAQGEVALAWLRRLLRWD